MFVSGQGGQALIPDWVIPKTQKMVLDASLLNTQHYKVQIKSKVEQSREWSCSYWKGTLQVSSTMVGQFFLLGYEIIYISWNTVYLDFHYLMIFLYFNNSGKKYAHSLSLNSGLSIHNFTFAWLKKFVIHNSEQLSHKKYFFSFFIFLHDFVNLTVTFCCTSF